MFYRKKAKKIVRVGSHFEAVLNTPTLPVFDLDQELNLQAPTPNHREVK